MSDGALGGAKATISLDAKGAIAALKEFGSAADQTMRSVGQSGTQAAGGFASFEKTLSSSNVQAAGGALAGIGAAVGLIGGFAINSAMQFDQGMANVRAATGATGEQFQALSDLALRIGKDTSFSATEATLAIEELAKAGVSTEDIMNGAADGVTALAAAGGVALPEAAVVMAGTLNQFGLEAGAASGYVDEFGNSVTNATHIADLLAGAATASGTGVSEMGSSLSYVGGTAAALGIPIEDVTTALGLMANQTIVGSSAGTSLNQALLSLANPTAKAAGVMQELGLSFTDVNGNLLPLPDIIGQVATATEGMGNATRQAYLEQIFGVEGGRAMNALLTSQTEAVQGTTDSWDGMEESVTHVGAAQEQAQARLNSTSGRLEGLKGSLETVGIVIGSKVLPFFDMLIIGATDVLGAFLELPSGIQTVIAAVVGVAGAFAGIAGAAILIGPRLIQVARGFQAVSIAMRAMTLSNPILLAIAAAIAVVALAVAAYKTNFLGFGDAVRAVGSTLKDAFGGVINFFKHLGEAFQINTQYMNPFSAAIHAVAGAILRINGGKIPGWLSDLGMKVHEVGGAVTGFVDGFKDKINELMAPMKGVIEITDVFGKKISVVGNVGPGLGRLAATFQALADTIRGIGGGDSGFFNGIADGIEWVGSAVQGVIGFFQTWQSAWERLTAPIKEARTATDAFGKTVSVMVNTGERMNGLVAIFMSLAEAIRGIGDGKIGWLNDIAAGFEEVGAIVGHFIKQIQPAIAILKAGFGEGFVAGLASIDVAFKLIAAAAGDALDSLGDLGKRAFARLGSAVGSLAGRFPALRNTFNALAKVIAKGGEIMADVFHLVADVLRGDFSGALDSLKVLGRDVLDGIGNGFELLVSIVTDVAGMLQSLLGSAFDALSSRFDRFSSTFDMLGGVVTNIIGVVRNLGEALLAAFSGDWSGVWENLQDAFTDAVQAILSAALLVPTFLLELFTGMSWTEVGSAIKNAFTDAFDAVRDAAQSAWDGLISGAAGLKDRLGSAISDALNGASSWIGSGLNMLSGWIGDVLTGAVNAWNDGIGTVKAFFTNLGGDVMALLSSGWDVLSGFMTEVIDGAVSSWNSGIGAVKSFFTNLASDLKTLVTSGAETLTGFIGDIIAGAVSAWNDGIGAVKSFFTTLGSDLAALVTGGADILTGFIGEVIQGAVDTWNSSIETLKSFFTGLGSALVGLVADGKDVLSGFIATVIAGAVEAWTANIETLKSFFTGLVAGLSGLVIGGRDLLVSFIADVVQGAVDAWTINIERLKAIFTGLASALTGLVVGGKALLAGFVADVVAGAIETWNTSIEALKAIFSGLVTGLSGLVIGGRELLVGFIADIIAGAIETWNTSIEGLKAIFSGLVTGLSGLITGGREVLTGFIGEVIAGAIDKWNGTISGLKTIFSTVGTGLKALVTGGKEVLSSFVGEIVSGAIAKWNAVVSGLKSIFTSLAADIGGLPGGGTAVLSVFIGGIVSGAIAKWGEVIGPLKDIFVNLGSDLAGLVDFSSITGAFDGIVGAVQPVIDKVNELIGVFSNLDFPSMPDWLGGGGDDTADKPVKGVYGGGGILTQYQGANGQQMPDFGSLSPSGGGTIAPPKVLPPDFGPATSAATVGQSLIAAIAAQMYGSVVTASGQVASTFTGLPIATLPPLMAMQAGTSAVFTGMQTGALLQSGLLKTGFTGNVAQMGTAVPVAVQQMGAATLPHFLAMQAGGIGNALAMNTGVVAHTVAMQGGSVASAGGMGTGVLGHFLGMQGGGVASAGALNSGTIGQFGAMKGAGVGHASGLNSGVLGQFGSMKGGGVGHASGLNSGVTGQMGSMKGAGIGHASALTGGVLGQFGSMQGGGVARAGGLNSGVSGQFGAMRGTATGHTSSMAGQVVGIIAGLQGSAGGAARGVGSAIGAGIAGGIQSWVGAIASAAAGAVSAAIGAARAAASIRSPSRVARDEVGIPISQGIAAGIQRAAGDIADAARGVVQGAIDGMVSIATSGFSVGVAASQGIADGITAQIGAVTGAVKGIVSEVDRGLASGLQVAPSRLTASYGRMSSEGYAQGITSSLSSVAGAVGKMVGTVSAGLTGLGGVRSISAGIAKGYEQNIRFYQGLTGTPWKVSAKPASWGPERVVEPNYTATNITDTMKVIADSFGSVLESGEWLPDSLIHLPTQAISDVMKQIGKGLTPFEGQAGVFEDAFAALKNLVATGTDDGLFARVPDAVESGLTTLADMLRDRFGVTEAIPAVTPPVLSGSAGMSGCVTNDYRNYSTFQPNLYVTVSGGGDPDAVGRAVMDALHRGYGDQNGFNR